MKLSTKMKTNEFHDQKLIIFFNCGDLFAVTIECL